MLSWSGLKNREPDPTYLEILQGMATVGMGVAHEIRNPLTVFKALRYSLGRSREGGQERNPEQLARDAEIIVHELERVEATLEAFVAFLEPAPTPEPFPQLLEAWRLLVEKRLQAGGIGLEISGILDHPQRVVRPQIVRALLLAVARTALLSLGSGAWLRVSGSDGEPAVVEFRGETGDEGRLPSEAAELLATLEQWAEEQGLSLRLTASPEGWGIKVPFFSAEEAVNRVTTRGSGEQAK